MFNGQSIQYVKKCMHLGNELCPINKHDIVLIDNAVNDLNSRLNNLLADFAHCSSSIRTCCMNMYDSQIWLYSRNYLNKFYISCRKAIKRL